MCTSTFYLQDVTDGMPSLWKLPVDVVSKSFSECLLLRRKLRILHSVFLDWVSTHLHEDVDHETLWRALLNEVRRIAGDGGVGSPFSVIHDVSKKKKLNLRENCQKYAPKLFSNVYTWHVSDDLIFYRQWANSHDRSQNGPKRVTNDYLVRALTFITHVITNNIVM